MPVTQDRVELDPDDFRRARCYLAPHLFADGVEGDTYPPPSDLISKEKWTGIMDLPTDVALRTSSYDGSVIARLADLHSDWIFSWPNVGEALYVEEPALLAGEEFDALVFNAIHGYYRQAIGCLRNALEILTVAAGLAVTNNQALYAAWRSGQEISYGQAVAWVRDSTVGQQINGVSPNVVFGKDNAAWAKVRYAKLCGYAHSRAGHNNADFWASNGPVYVPSALEVVEKEFRETLALAYLLVRLGWPTYQSGRGQPNLLAGDCTGWGQYVPLLTSWLR
jgi:hypothetical protein